MVKVKKIYYCNFLTFTKFLDFYQNSQLLPNFSTCQEFSSSRCRRTVSWSSILNEKLSRCSTRILCGKVSRYYRSIRNRKTENSWLLVPYSTKANIFWFMDTWFICLNFLSFSIHRSDLLFSIWYQEAGVFCLSVSDRSVDTDTFAILFSPKS